MVLGDPESDELYALKRISFGARSSFTLSFQGPAPDLAEVVLYLVCDSYLGMDQQTRISMPGHYSGPQVRPAALLYLPKLCSTAQEISGQKPESGRCDAAQNLSLHYLA